MRAEALKVGELARRTGITIRTLHHYDDIGLLNPSLHTEAGHRLYTHADVARLQQILSLRQLGFSLEQIRDCLEKPGFSPVEVIDLHLAKIQEQIRLQQGLCERLQALAARFRQAEEVSVDEFLHTMEAMTMVEEYYTPEQLDYLKQRREAVGEERMQQAPRDWEQLMAEVRTEMDKGTDPAAPEVQALARRWSALIEEFTGGDPGIRDSLNRMWQDKGDQIAAEHHMNYDPKMYEYMGRAIEILKGSA